MSLSPVLFFQPAEEPGQGAKAMMADGLFERFPADNVYAMHNMPSLSVGTFAVRPGPVMTCEDRFEIVIEGRGDDNEQRSRAYQR